MRAFTRILVLVFAVVAGPSHAHNNPSYEKTTVLEITVEVSADATGRHAGPFTLDLDKNTIQLHYRVQAADAAAIRFSVARGKEVLAAALGDGGKSKVLRGKGLAIVDLTGATGAFTLEIIAEVLVRKKSS